MTTITLHLPDPAPLAALAAFAESIGCQLRHSFGDGYRMQPRDAFAERGLILTIKDDLCAAWREGGTRTFAYLQEAFEMASASRDLEAMMDVHSLIELLIVKTSIEIMAGAV